MIKQAKGKKAKRLRRAKSTRYKIKSLDIPRLCIHRTLNHIYAQVILPDGNVIAKASTLDKAFKSDAKFKTGNIQAAVLVGKLVAERALKKEIKKIAFDRSGFKFHGRVKALADAARETGLEF